MMTNIKKKFMLMLTVLVFILPKSALTDYPPINYGNDGIELSRPALDPNEVVKIARTYAIENGFNLTDKSSDDVTYIYIYISSKILDCRF